MNSNNYSDMELHLMSYQDLRRLSILLHLPANIKKKYMISMIQAHQNGDGCLKTAIANKVLEERKVRRLNSKKKQSKSYMLDSSLNSQQIPTDLSVSTQHEIETRVSYVAHYSSKDELSSGISRIIKQEAEVSRRNRSILQPPRKPTRKLSTVGRTEIMLPRNHSLTTPVRLMPQYERGYPPPTDYDSMSGLSNSKTHFQDINYNYYFHGEFSNSLMPTTSHEMYRSEPYWHTREVYNNSLMPILSNLLTPNSVTISSSSYASQYTSGNSVKGTASFQQGVYENYIKSNSIVESQALQSSASNSSTLTLSNHHLLSDSNGNNYNVNRGGYLMSNGDVDFELTSAANELNCHYCAKRDEGVFKSSNETQGFLEFYPRHGDPISSPKAACVGNARDAPQYSGYRTETKEMTLPLPHRPFESSSVIAYKATEILETDVRVHEAAPQTTDGYESSCTEEDKVWEESDQGLKKVMETRKETESFADGSLPSHGQGSNLSKVSDMSITFSIEMESNDKPLKTNEKEIPTYAPNFSRCRYTSGHNKYPEAVSDSNKTKNLPSFLSTFCTNEFYNRAYSVCKNSVTGTTETHLNPIMTCTYASQFSSHANSQQTQVNDAASEPQIQRQWYYTYPESQLPFSVESTAYTAWNEYPNEMDNKMMATSTNHNVQVVKCRTHGCHYLYSISNPCD